MTELEKEAEKAKREKIANDKRIRKERAESLKDAVVHNLETFRGFPMIFTHDRKEGVITGVNPKTEMNVGDSIIAPGRLGYYIIESVERRDAEGNYSLPELAKEAFFEAKCKYVSPTPTV